MSSSSVVRHDQLPSMLQSYLRAVTGGRRRLKPGEVVPHVEAVVARVSPDRGQVERYRRRCHLGPGLDVPLTYLHIQAVPLHMAVLTDPRFPLPTLGLVHVRNSIVQHRPLGIDEPYTLRVWVDGHREVRAGLEVDIRTTVEAGGERIWEDVMTALSRVRRSSGSKARLVAVSSSEPWPLSSEWALAANEGRRYGLVAGDLNPIHLWNWTARPFGFKRVIIQGMYALARSVGELRGQGVGVEQGRDLRLDVRFKRPIALPSTSRFGARVSDGVAAFEVRSLDGTVLHLEGSLGPAEGASIVD